MTKLTISKPAKKADKNVDQNLDQLLKYSAFQIGVPGVGRLRTGERHPDFHIESTDETLVPKMPAESGPVKGSGRKR
jgi:hypothetical protein